MQKISLFLLGITIFQNFSLGATESGKSTYSFPAVVGAIAFLGENIMVSDKDKGLCLKDFQGNTLKEYNGGDTDPVEALVVSHDKTFMAHAKRKGNAVKLFDMNTGKCIHTITTREKFFTYRLCVDETGNIITGNDRMDCFVVDKRTGKITAKSNETEPLGLFEHVLSPSGKEIVFVRACPNNVHFVWDLRNNRHRAFKEYHLSPSTSSVDWTSNNPVVIGNCDNTVDIFSAQRSYYKERTITLPASSHANVIVKSNPKSNVLAAATKEDNTLFICDSVTGEIVDRLQPQGCFKYCTSRLAWDETGNIFAGSSEKSGLVEIWDLSKKSDN